MACDKGRAPEKSKRKRVRQRSCNTRELCRAPGERCRAALPETPSHICRPASRARRRITAKSAIVVEQAYRRAAEGGAVGAVAEGHQQRRAARRTIRSRSPCRPATSRGALVGGEKGGRDHDRGHVVGEGVGCREQCRRRQCRRLQRVVGPGPPDPPHDDREPRRGHPLREPGEYSAAVQVADQSRIRSAVFPIPLRRPVQPGWANAGAESRSRRRQQQPLTPRPGARQ